MFEKREVACHFYLINNIWCYFGFLMVGAGVAVIGRIRERSPAQVLGVGNAEAGFSSPAAGGRTGRHRPRCVTAMTKICRYGCSLSLWVNRESPLRAAFPVVSKMLTVTLKGDLGKPGSLLWILFSIGIVDISASTGTRELLELPKRTLKQNPNKNMKSCGGGNSQIFCYLVVFCVFLCVRKSVKICVPDVFRSAEDAIARLCKVLIATPSKCCVYYSQDTKTYLILQKICNPDSL